MVEIVSSHLGIGLKKHWDMRFMAGIGAILDRFNR
jgi:hypothetical protein